MDITQLLAFSVRNNASDLHLSAGLPPMIRVHGDVRRINVEALEHKQVHDMVYDIMNDSQRKHYEDSLECDFSFEIQGLARFRVNAFNQNRGAGAVFRFTGVTIRRVPGACPGRGGRVSCMEVLLLFGTGGLSLGQFAMPRPGAPSGAILRRGELDEESSFDHQAYAITKFTIKSFRILRGLVISFENSGEGAPSPFPLPQRARVKCYGMDYPSRYCVLSDSLALWERLRVRAIFILCGRA